MISGLRRRPHQARPPGCLYRRVQRLQPGQPDPGRVAALELGQQRLQRVAAVQVIGAVRDDEQHPGRADIAGQERDQVPGRAVGPVQVLHHDRSRCHLAQTHEEVEHPLEQQAARARLGAGHSGQQRSQIIDPRARQLRHDLPAQLPVKVPEDLDQRRVGQRPRGDVDAPAGGRRPPFPVRPLAELLHQTRLADAGVAGDNHQLPAT